jgi:hypothetical protein
VIGLKKWMMVPLINDSLQLKTEIGMDILLGNESISLAFEDRFWFVSQKQVYLFV